MSFDVRIEIVDRDTKAKTEIFLPAVTDETLRTLNLPIGDLFREGTLFAKSTGMPA